MKKYFLILFALIVCSMSVYAAVDGDVDGDGYVTTTDVTALYNYLLSGDTETLINGDVDGDGYITIGDVTWVYNIILGIMNENHEYVDLGLTSGTLWATMNVGASSPEDYGNYFAWGETEQKEYYGWNTYQWCNGNWNTLTKYCCSSNYDYNGFVDNLSELDPENDAAAANWGSQWRMPSDEQLEELLSQCSWQWTTSNGVKGYKVTSKHNGATLFLPASGYYFCGELYSIGNIAYYWSRTLYTSRCYYAYYFWFHSSGTKNLDTGDRNTGFTVRAVRVSQ